jgi:hypothetical protein
MSRTQKKLKARALLKARCALTSCPKGSVLEKEEPGALFRGDRWGKGKEEKRPGLFNCVGLASHQPTERMIPRSLHFVKVMEQEI